MEMTIKTIKKTLLLLMMITLIPSCLCANHKPEQSVINTVAISKTQKKKPKPLSNDDLQAMVKASASKRKQKTSSGPKKKANKSKPGSNIVTLSDYKHDSADERSDNEAKNLKVMHEVNQINKKTLEMQEQEIKRVEALTSKVEAYTRQSAQVIKEQAAIIAKDQAQTEQHKRFLEEIKQENENQVKC